ncbi:MAG TPA: cation transporter [Verrucomicrobiae bacterium]|nr:cation transporter [Verrucomicrobiae bacterium]
MMQPAENKQPGLARFATLLAMRRGRLNLPCPPAGGPRLRDDRPFLRRQCNNTEMVSITLSPDANALRRIHRIQILTIVWMSVEAGVSLAAAWTAHSPALAAFGGDSAIELLSAAVVLWAFRRKSGHRVEEKRAARAAGILLFALAAYVTIVSAMALLGYSEPKPSYMGIAILIAAAAIMPWLAIQKRELSATTGSAALRADAAQSGLCAYLSLIALAGIAANAIGHISWADPLAAQAITPLILWEAKEAIRGKSCGCC